MAPLREVSLVDLEARARRTADRHPLPVGPLTERAGSGLVLRGMARRGPRRSLRHHRGSSRASRLSPGDRSAPRGDGEVDHAARSAALGRTILRVAVFELRHRGNIPSVDDDERGRGGGDRSSPRRVRPRFVNGILGKIASEMRPAAAEDPGTISGTFRRHCSSRGRAQRRCGGCGVHAADGGGAASDTSSPSLPSSRPFLNWPTRQPRFPSDVGQLAGADDDGHNEHDSRPQSGICNRSYPFRFPTVYAGLSRGSARSAHCS